MPCPSQQAQTDEDKQIHIAEHGTEGTWTHQDATILAFRENNVLGKNLGYLSAAKTIPDSSEFNVETMTDEELEDVVRTNARGIPMVLPLRFQLEESGSEEWLFPWNP